MFAEKDELTKQDIEFLKIYVNPVYLKSKYIKDINKQFCEESSLQLNNFLKQELIDQLNEYLILSDHLDAIGHSLPQLDYTKGINNGWQLVGPPHKKRYLAYKGVDNNNISNDNKNYYQLAGQLMNDVNEKLFKSKIFAKYLKIVTSVVPTGLFLLLSITLLLLLLFSLLLLLL